ncbi:hypothetical protein ACFW84_33035 [Streptomyces anulatus]|uniref:hypothetical protein n=1 Tax=Streptomyces anulatus TaxID=1892 RepID=UPI0036CCB6F8
MGEEIDAALEVRALRSREVVGADTDFPQALYERLRLRKSEVAEGSRGPIALLLGMRVPDHLGAFPDEPAGVALSFLARQDEGEQAGVAPSSQQQVISWSARSDDTSSVIQETTPTVTATQARSTSATTAATGMRRRDAGCRSPAVSWEVSISDQ